MASSETWPSRAGAGEQHVMARLHHRASQADGIADALDRGDGARTQRAAVHHDGVERDVAVAVQMRAGARVVLGIVFQRDDCGFHGVQCETACGEDLPSGVERLAAARLACVRRSIWYGERAAVDDEGGIHGDILREDDGKG